MGEGLESWITLNGESITGERGGSQGSVFSFPWGKDSAGALGLGFKGRGWRSN